MYNKITLPNKLRILAVPLKNTETLTVLILVKVGSKNEVKKINGISHFLEHLFYKGTPRRPRTLDIGKAFDEIGGEYNAFTSQEYTGFYAKVNSKHFEVALDVLSDILLNSKFEKKELEKERGVIIEEINMYQDTPMEYIETLWHQVLYGNQPAGWDIAGTKETVTAITRKQIINYYKKFYVPENIVICVAGNLSGRENNIFDKVKKYFDYSNVESTIAKKISVDDSQSMPKALVQSKKTDQTHLMLGVRGYDMFHKDRFALKLLSVILGGGMSSRLFSEIREKRGLSYYIYTKAESDMNSGYLVTGSGLDNSKVEDAIKIILEEYGKMKSGDIKEDELSKAKEYLKGRMILNLESSDEWANFIAGQDLLRGEILTMDNIFSSIERVTNNDLKRVANDIFVNQKLNLALIGPIKAEKKIKKILKL